MTKLQTKGRYDKLNYTKHKIQNNIKRILTDTVSMSKKSVINIEKVWVEC